MSRRQGVEEVVLRPLGVHGHLWRGPEAASKRNGIAGPAENEVSHPDEKHIRAVDDQGFKFFCSLGWSISFWTFRS